MRCCGSPGGGRAREIQNLFLGLFLMFLGGNCGTAVRPWYHRSPTVVRKQHAWFLCPSGSHSSGEAFSPRAIADMHVSPPWGARKFQPQPAAKGTYLFDLLFITTYYIILSFLSLSLSRILNLMLQVQKGCGCRLRGGHLGSGDPGWALRCCSGVPRGGRRGR